MAHAADTAEFSIGGRLTRWWRMRPKSPRGRFITGVLVTLALAGGALACFDLAVVPRVRSDYAELEALAAEAEISWLRLEELLHVHGVRFEELASATHE